MNFTWLERYASNKYSQYGEDGIIEAIFAHIVPANRWCFECGASDGIFFSNTRKLIHDGWNAILVEAEDQSFKRLTRNSGPFGERVRVCRDRITTMDPVLSLAGAPADIDLVVIDVDGQDYYLFNSMLKFKPRVVLVEYDCQVDPDFIPDYGEEGQAGLTAMRKLAAGRFYTEVYRTWSNLILVKQPLDRLLDFETGSENET